VVIVLEYHSQPPCDQIAQMLDYSHCRRRCRWCSSRRDAGMCGRQPCSFLRPCEGHTAAA
jgi:hypothetical protein